MANQIVKLTDGGNNLYPHSALFFIDFDNVIASVKVTGTGYYTYTATEYCYIRVRIGNVLVMPKVNGTTIQVLGEKYADVIVYNMFLKKGDTFSWDTDNHVGHEYIVYGIRR